MVQGQIKAHHYMVNLWFEPKSTGTACLWRGTDRDEWIRQIRKALKEHPTRPRMCRTVTQQDRTVFSMTSENAWDMWSKATVYPVSEVVLGIPREVTE